MNQNESEQNQGEGPGILIGIVVAIIVGIIIGGFAPTFAVKFTILGDVFLNSLKMMVGSHTPFCSMVATIMYLSIILLLTMDLICQVVWRTLLKPIR